MRSGISILLCLNVQKHPDRDKTRIYKSKISKEFSVTGKNGKALINIEITLKSATI